MRGWRSFDNSWCLLAASGLVGLLAGQSIAGPAATPSPPVVHAPAAAAAAAREVFQSPEFWWKRLEARTVENPSWLSSAVSAVLEFLGRIIRNFFEWLAEILRRLLSLFDGSSRGGSDVVRPILALFAAFILWKLGRSIVRRLRGGPLPPTASPSEPPETLAEASELFDQAGQALAAGLYSESIRLALLAFIARCQQEGLLRYDPTRTNREYQIELRRAGTIAVTFGQVARIYERVWYGREPASRAEATLAIHHCRSLIEGKELAPE